MVAGTSLRVLSFVTMFAFATAFVANAQTPTFPKIIDTTSSDTNPTYRQLLDEEDQDFIQLLRSELGDTLTQDKIDKARQPATMADVAWLKASGYNFTYADNIDADLKILMVFWSMPLSVLLQNNSITNEINHDANARQKEHALFDADGLGFLFYLAEALGPKLGDAFLKAYDKDEMRKAAALMQATVISTGKAKSYFSFPRPFTVPHNTIDLEDDEYIRKDSALYRASGDSYPSGHAEIGYTEALLLAAMVPERFLPLLDRAAGYGFSRVVLGVHYPLDVIASRMIAERNVAHFLNDPAYRALFNEAKSELRAVLEKECGESLPACAKPASDSSDPWANPAQSDFYRYTMTYGLPQIGPNNVPMQVPDRAEVLLEPLRPDLSAADRKDLLARTALPSGYPLDSSDPHIGFWQRINLYEAAAQASSR